ncbi:MAG: hypothetical protein ACRCUT_00830 [Spirochaetota bacterium]
MAGPDIQIVVREAMLLLESDNLMPAFEKFKADTPEKEIALEYVSSYAQFIRDVAENDLAKNIQRADYEIRELVGHINAMLKQKQGDIFMKMVLMCPKHYLSFLRQQK